MYTIITDRFNGYPNHDLLFMLATDIYLNNNEWDVHILGRLNNFRRNFGDNYYEENRIQISSTWDGEFMFVSWLDTDLPGVYENNQPDIYCRGISCLDQRTTYLNGADEPYNVTTLTAGIRQAYL